ncbi:MAG: hypothetical protein KDD52_06310 [Bdellovibrionales bacterium]|nr:hypothetical protein [Bdellovibrionales bacterium]
MKKNIIAGFLIVMGLSFAHAQNQVSLDTDLQTLIGTHTQKLFTQTLLLTKAAIHINKTISPYQKYTEEMYLEKKEESANNFYNYLQSIVNEIYQ